jgi:hypothetical protein
MNSLFYLLAGLVSGLAIVGTIVVLLRGRGQGVDVAVNARSTEEELVKRLEIIDRGLRDEFSRNREEAGALAKAQREELSKSLEGVRSIVDVRLKQLQEDN